MFKLLNFYELLMFIYYIYFCFLCNFFKLRQVNKLILVNSLYFPKGSHYAMNIFYLVYDLHNYLFYGKKYTRMII